MGNSTICSWHLDEPRFRFRGLNSGRRHVLIRLHWWLWVYPIPMRWSLVRHVAGVLWLAWPSFCWVDVPVQDAFNKLDGSWGLVQETKLPNRPLIPLVACGGHPDKQHGVIRGKALTAQHHRPLAGVRISYS